MLWEKAVGFAIQKIPIKCAPEEKAPELSRTPLHPESSGGSSSAPPQYCISTPTCPRDRDRRSSRERGNDLTREDSAKSRPQSSNCLLVKSPRCNVIDLNDNNDKPRRSRSATDPVKSQREESETCRPPSSSGRAHDIPASAQKRSWTRDRSCSTTPIERNRSRSRAPTPRRILSRDVEEGR